LSDDQEIDVSQLNVIKPAFDVNAEVAADIRDMQNIYLSCFAEFRTNEGKACIMAKVTRGQVRSWIERYPEFAAREKEIREAVNDDIEDVFPEIALGKEYPAAARVSAAEKFLKARRPEVYNPDHSGNRGNVQVNIVFADPNKKKPKVISTTAKMSGGDEKTRSD